MPAREKCASENRASSTLAGRGAGANTDIDYSAEEALKELHADLTKLGVVQAPIRGNSSMLATDPVPGLISFPLDANHPMSETVKQQIQALVDQATLGLNTKNVDLFLDMIHPDMVWPWPSTSRDHDPVRWEFLLGRFNKERWRQNFQAIFDHYDLVHNHRDTVRIEVSAEEDAALAVVDVDSLWRDKNTDQEIHWKGRVCNIYTKTTAGDWKLIFQTGPLDYALCRD